MRDCGCSPGKGPKIVWTADKSGIGHAARLNSARAYCGRAATPQRFGWPITIKCATCRYEVQNATAHTP